MSERETDESSCFDGWVGDEDKVAIRVPDDAMRHSHLVEGDYVVVDTSRIPAPGDVSCNGKILAVRGDDGVAILRRYYWRREKNHASLEADVAPTMIRDSVRVVGLMIGVVRRY